VLEFMLQRANPSLEILDLLFGGGNQTFSVEVYLSHVLMIVDRVAADNSPRRAKLVGGGLKVCQRLPPDK
jgi:hypothetical protein